MQRSVKNYLSETCEFLKQMLRTVNVREETTSTLAKIRCCSIPMHSSLPHC